MRKIYFLIAFLIAPIFIYAQDIPKPIGWVNDFANVISPEYKEKLNSLIEELEQKTTSEIAVVTINSIAPYDEKAYARLLFDNWKPGKKGKDNGVLVLLAIKERRWRIETGYGVEGILPDGLCGEIGRNYIVPYFKEGKYSEGLYKGTLKISQVIAKGTNVNLKTLEGFKESASGGETLYDYLPLWIILFMFIFFFFPIIAIISSRSRYSGYHYGGWGYGGGFGGGSGGFGGGGFGGGGFGGGGGGGGGAGGGF